MKWVLLGFALSLLTAGDKAAAQYMYLDVNGNGAYDSGDLLPSSGTVSISIWLQTDKNRDGTDAGCLGGGSYTITSYEFILRVVGGAVSWGSYSNYQLFLFPNLFGAASSADQYHRGYYGSSAVSPGLYKLGTLDVTVASGHPSIEIVSTTTLGATYKTSFGSGCQGIEGDNTIRLGMDWYDADGLPASGSVQVYSEGFEITQIPGGIWSAYDNNPYSGLDFWGDESDCAYTHQGFYSASCVGNSDILSCELTYANDQAAVLENWSAINMSPYEQFTVSFWLWVGTEATDQFRWYGGTTGDLSTPKGSAFGSSNGWVFIQNTWSNLDHRYDNLYLKFTFTSDASITATGVFVDDLLIRGIPRPPIPPGKPNLRPYQPSDWPATIVVTPVSGNQLQAGKPMYIDVAFINDSDVPAPASGARVYLNYPCDYVPVPAPALAAHATATVSDVYWGGTCAYPSGSAQNIFRMIVDYWGDVDEAVESDNTFDEYYYIAAEDVRDLEMLPLASTSYTVPEGDSVTVTAVVRNAGQLGTGAFKIGLYRDRSSPPSVGTTPDDSTTVSSGLGAGASTTVTFRVASPTPTTNRMYALADFRNQVPEGSGGWKEGNNWNGPVVVTWNPGNLVVKGRFAFIDPVSGEERVAPCTYAYVIDSDLNEGSLDDTLETVWIDANGRFTSSVLLNQDADDSSHGHLDIRVTQAYASKEECWDASYPRNKLVASVRHQSLSPWVAGTGTVSNIPNGTYIFPDVVQTDYGHCAAMHMYRLIQDAGWSWVKSHFGLTDSLYIVWDPGWPTPATRWLSGLPGNPQKPTRIEVNGGHAIATRGPDELDDAVLLHEYGHHAAWTNGFFAVYDSTSHQAPIDSAQTDLAISWNEGWGYFFGAFRQQWPTFDERPFFRNVSDSSNVTSFTSVDLERCRLYTSPAPGSTDSLVAIVNGNGPYWDIAVAGALWDIYDTQDDNQQPSTNPWGDRFSDGVIKLWDALGGLNVRSVCDVQARYDSLFNNPYSNSLRAELSREVFRQHGIQCKSTATPISPTGVTETDAVRGIRLSVGPNPAASFAAIGLHIGGRPPEEEASLDIVDVQGRLVRRLYRGHLQQGALRLGWNGTNVGGAEAASGVYYCVLRVGDIRRTKRVVLLR